VKNGNKCPDPEPTQTIDGVVPYTYWTVGNGSAEPTEGGVIEEATLTIRLNAMPIATVMCSPVDLESLALGFLYNEGIIERYEDVASVDVDAAEDTINVTVSRPMAAIRRQVIRTSGCGGGVTFAGTEAGRGKVQTDFTTVPAVIHDRMRDLQGAARLYQTVRGVHTAILATEDAVVYAAEDVGRHNTLDKIAGQVFRDGFDASNTVLLTSGRISSEMLGKANRMNIPIVASRTAPTSISVELGDKWDICVIGYVRRGSFRVYTHPYRLGLGVM
jgi:FdhD protein